jgi:hypothetical protein
MGKQYSVYIHVREAEDLPPLFGDADDCCQWEVQTDAGWILYWDSQA